MLIGGSIGTAAGAATAFLMKKKDLKSMIIFSAIGLAVGLAGAYFVGGKPADTTVADKAATDAAAAATVKTAEAVKAAAEAVKTTANTEAKK